MGLFTRFSAPDINAGVAECRATAGAFLLDVRTEEEYRAGHIDGSTNLPLDKIASVGSVVGDKSTPLYVHCLSGSRSGRAVSWLQQAGYTNATNIGGISRYRGKVVQ